MSPKTDVSQHESYAPFLSHGFSIFQPHNVPTLRPQSIQLAPTPDPALCDITQFSSYAEQLYLPWQCGQGRLVVATAAPFQNYSTIRAQFYDPIHLHPISQAKLLHALTTHFQDRLLYDAINGLADAEPALSAQITFTQTQKNIFRVLAITVLTTLLFLPRIALALLSAFLVLSYLANIFFRFLLVWRGTDQVRQIASGPIAPIPDHEVPLYTILVPLYQEAEIVPQLVCNLLALDYPRHKLDIKLIIEEDDSLTSEALSKFKLDACFDIIRVPPSHPRTKPKACNYALHFARGEFTVIFDAEDRPEPDQLRKAVAKFRAVSPQTGCLQARLNFDNRNENWLTRLFTLDYALWFDFLLPGLDAMGVPMPLGGTSNHFRTSALRQIHGWDAFNVTEDADLGIRLARLGYRATTLDSTTFEEATNSIPAWLGQRSRWLKGYMQTWLVHMRHPVQLWRNAGAGGFFAFQLFIGGTFLCALANPLMWLLVCLCQISSLSLYTGPLDQVFSYTALFCLIIGNGLFIYLTMLGAARRGWLELTPFGFGAPFYWLLMSLAAYRAFWQLLHRPFHWEKTRHGVSRAMPKPMGPAA